MWWKEYRDYPRTESLIKEKVETGKGIVGCEMHELNGWGEEYHKQKRKTDGFFIRLCRAIFRESSVK